MYGVISARCIVATGEFPSRPRPWCARLSGLDAKYGFKRDFVRGTYDYSRATRKGKNVYVYFALAPGLYEFYRPVSWKHESREFLRVDDNGDVHYIEREEVVSCLTKSCSESTS